MSTVTAVPLLPIAKGSLTRLWIGVAILLLAAGALAWAGTVSLQPLGFEVLEEGEGPSPTLDDVVLVSYVGKLTDGKVFDQSEQQAFPVGEVVPGFSQALLKMKKGGHYKVTIPPRLGYGAKAAGPIPANSTLIFDVHLRDFKSKEEIMRMQQQMQMMQGGAGGPPMPGAPAPGQ
ncbi:MAG: FKBP-type peptidyl-prolyl cis-trans isomerase [Sphingobium phenoxybenzoativorans]|uniref:FKBP-type peptidyl-prolyl cis-trans isomerase n=1 Tax=Sphingobium phenoxybenzoativorans TaxID=1592790 RepID=UPI00087290D0|nr:FKBP-type peptidyl-prolyl cis-trans isomerase [Sphingobium phenoxybenzoativorans]